METFIYHPIYLLDEGMNIPKLHPWPVASRKCDSGSKGRSLKDVLPKVKDGKGSNHNMPSCIINIYIYTYIYVCVCVSSIIVTASYTHTHTHAHAKDHWLWRCHPQTIYMCVWRTSWQILPWLNFPPGNESTSGWPRGVTWVSIPAFECP